MSCSVPRVLYRPPPPLVCASLTAPGEVCLCVSEHRVCRCMRGAVSRKWMNVSLSLALLLELVWARRCTLHFAVVAPLGRVVVVPPVRHGAPGPLHGLFRPPRNSRPHPTLWILAWCGPEGRAAAGLGPAGPVGQHGWLPERFFSPRSGSAVFAPSSALRLCVPPCPPPSPRPPFVAVSHSHFLILSCVVRWWARA